jgi:hypothetical protein
MAEKKELRFKQIAAAHTNKDLLYGLTDDGRVYALRVEAVDLEPLVADPLRELLPIGWIPLPMNELPPEKPKKPR